MVLNDCEEFLAPPYITAPSQTPGLDPQLFCLYAFETSRSVRTKPLLRQRASLSLTTF